MASKFSNVLKGVLQEEVIIPRLRTYLYNPTFPSFTVPMEGFKRRVPDGYFHPSTHPLWGERQLWYYAKGERLIHEPMEPTGTLLVTQGNFWHAFVQTCGVADGWLRVMTPDGKTQHDKAEFYVEDIVTGAAGSMDGVLNSDTLPIEWDQGFEMKTMSAAKSVKCPKGTPTDPAKLLWFKEKCPVYYAQAQEYLRMSGYQAQRVLIITLENPFPMIEILVPFDRVFARNIEDKYNRVRLNVANNVIPTPCCGTFTKEAKSCPARNLCPVGRLSIQ